MNYISPPHLTEFGTIHYFKNTLKNCSIKKKKIQNKIFNIVLLFIFLFIIGITLYYMYKGKLSPKEKYIKNQSERKYILEKIQSLQIQKQIENNKMITNIPMVNDQPGKLDELRYNNYNLFL
tara:strand:- start:10 stop:375 length:366 start_codon:yes stop_codon:yes gene_type:complete